MHSWSACELVVAKHVPIGKDHIMYQSQHTVICFIEELHLTEEDLYVRDLHNNCDCHILVLLPRNDLMEQKFSLKSSTTDNTLSISITTLRNFDGYITEFHTSTDTLTTAVVVEGKTGEVEWWVKGEPELKV